MSRKSTKENVQTKTADVAIQEKTLTEKITNPIAYAYKQLQSLLPKRINAVMQAYQELYKEAIDICMQGYKRSFSVITKEDENEHKKASLYIGHKLTIRKYDLFADLVEDRVQFEKNIRALKNNMLEILVSAVMFSLRFVTNNMSPCTSASLQELFYDIMQVRLKSLGNYNNKFSQSMYHYANHRLSKHRAFGQIKFIDNNKAIQDIEAIDFCIFPFVLVKPKTIDKIYTSEKIIESMKGLYYPNPDAVNFYIELLSKLDADRIKFIFNLFIEHENAKQLNANS